MGVVFLDCRGGVVTQVKRFNLAIVVHGIADSFIDGEIGSKRGVFHHD